MGYIEFAVFVYGLTCIVCAYGNKEWKPAGCQLPAVTGPCKASIKAWHYNSKGKCEAFVYGGCEGNSNNFETKKMCERRCGWRYSRKRDICLLPPQKEKHCGNKSVEATRWYFDENKSKCKQRIFQTCQKDPKGFATCSECVTTCKHHMKTLQACQEVGNPK
ncbi:BPTI/Kunitz domain-containing protein-like [Dermacentor silvarum]|uniref:BPTI/Kunitz domain-containing protein-like n=1 Tax=Dermacentor silvarum TaxID=543639 RepID=UPI00189A4804|nr:BPTI/Kunitz domain-containing protein-like [Dermacentor silvarum]